MTFFSWLYPFNTNTVIENQHNDLKELLNKKQLQVEKLLLIQEKLTADTQMIQKATLETQQILTKKPFPNLSCTLFEAPPSPSRDPLTSLKELIKLAHLVEQGKAYQQMKDVMDTLHQQIQEKIDQAEAFEQEAQRLEGTIEKLKQLVAQRKETIELVKSQTHELINL